MGDLIEVTRKENAQASKEGEGRAQVPEEGI